MSIVPTTAIIANRFSLVGLPPIASIPFAPTILSRPTDLPDDLLCLSAAANDFILHCDDDEAGDPPSDAWPNHILPMGNRTDASDPIDTRDFSSLDPFGSLDTDTDHDSYTPSPADEAFHLAYTLEALGIPASPPPEIARDPEAGLRWSRGKYAARAAHADRNARVAREKADRDARGLLAAAGHGQATGWTGGPRIAPHGYSTAQCERFLAGYDAGEAEYLKSVAGQFDGAGDGYDEAGEYGGQIGRAVAEDVADRLERVASGDWSFIG